MYFKKGISSSIKAWEMPREERNSHSWKLQAHKQEKLAHHGNCGATLNVASLVRNVSAYYDYEKWFINSETILLEKKKATKPNQSKRNSDRIFNEKVIEETC